MENINHKLTVEAIVNAPIEKVWQTWINPEDIEQWNSPSDDWHTPKAKNDAKAGGKFVFTMAAKDGSVSFDFEGEYSNIENHKKIEYKIADGRMVTVLFEDLGGSVKVTEIFEAENVHSLEMQEQGWQAILNSFKQYTEKK